jgi:hypothetical protein
VQDRTMSTTINGTGKNTEVLEDCRSQLNCLDKMKTCSSGALAPQATTLKGRGYIG